MPTVLNNQTGEVEKLSYDKEGIEEAKEMERSGEGLIISNDARNRSETTYG
tara:strand:+ start:660 stop:812 length:153 start_codon:yes stop_codon:yes gene_type:complete